MLTLRDIMTRDLLTVSPELSIREAIELLLGRHVSGAPVVSGGRVVGVVSATDLLAFAATLPNDIFDGDADPLPDADTERAAEEGGEPERTFFAELWEDDVDVRFDVRGAGRTPGVNAHTVSDAMTAAPVCALPPSVSVDTAADYMRRAQIHRLLVMTGAILDGIVTTTDIANAVADHQLTTRTFVFGPARHFDGRR